ncbi:MAG: precorrin-6A reductase [Methanobacterium sp.]
MRVMVMAGTSDAVTIISELDEYQDFQVIATTTTSYGGDLALSAGADEIVVGRLGVQEINDLIVVNKIDLLVDATHPFAYDASINALKAAHISGIKYMRYERPSIKIPENVIEVSSFHEAGEMALKLMEKNPDARILHLAGVTTIYEVSKLINPKMIVARVLPMVSSVKKCLEIGIPRGNIIAMQGTFTKEFNLALMKEYAIGVVLTKESGETGGTPSKIEAAKELEIPLIIVKRPIIPEMENEMVFSDINHLVKSIMQLHGN